MVAAKINSNALRGWPQFAAIAVGLVLLVAALAKIFLPAAKSSAFGTLAGTAPWLSWTIIGTEILLAVWLISGWRSGGAAAIAVLLFSIYSGVIVHDMLKRHPQPCGCFGRAWQQAHEPAIIERHLAVGLGGDALLVAALGVVLVTGGARNSTDETSSPIAGEPSSAQTSTSG